jgi:hypothetical protein
VRAKLFVGTRAFMMKILGVFGLIGALGLK